jgi:crotonobetainyl-CoA:carnitine CoA-transferase CaiB-like acyl-CoA transferase
VIDQPELKTDPRFATNGDRLANREILTDKLKAIFINRDADEWLVELRQAGLPCGSTNSISDVFDNPQVQARNMVMEVEHPTAGSVRLTGFPYKLSQTPAIVHRPPPLLGEHTEKVLVEYLGYPAEKVAQLKESGAI